ncbi:arginine-hydroxylase NDUFAF5, mitochondrial-like isoform X2 [Convolutriloba macropyga]
MLDPDDVNEFYQCDLSSRLLDRAIPSTINRTKSCHIDEERIEFEKDFFNLVLTCGSLHWVNDLPGLMHRVMRTLVPDGVFLGSMLGGDTLFELRTAIQLAEQELENGFGPHVSPMVNMPDMGRLLHQAGFKMITVDVDEICVRYPDMRDLMADLCKMGEASCTWNKKPSLRRDTIVLAATKYREMYGNEDSIPATFQTINFIGWKPHPSQPKAKPRGSAEISFIDQFRQEAAKNDTVKDS